MVAAASLPKRIGEYEVLGLIGEGGMGRVFRAVQARLKRPVCIKTLLPRALAEAGTVMRFEQEAINTAALHHPNIVAVHDVGHTPDGAPYIVMELLEGTTLRQLIAAEAPLKLERAVRLIDQVLAGLGEAHSAGMVHRDLKPANVMVVSQRDGSESCKVLDFGIARCLDASGQARLTQTGLVPGTPGYIAPEQIAGQPFDHRADLYAAGALFYELLCGKKPFTAPNAAQLMHLTVMEDPPPPSSRTPQHVPAEIDAVALKAMARDPSQRYQSAAAFRAALQRIDGPIEVDVELEIDTTPLAVRMQPGEALNHARSLVRGVFQSDGWERAKLTEALGARLRELFQGHHLDELHEAMQSIEAFARQPGDPQAATDARAALSEAAAEHYALLLDWLRRPQTRLIATTLLRAMGRSQLDRMVESLGEVEREHVPGLFGIIIALEGPRELIERLSHLDGRVMRRCLAATAALTDTAFEPLLHAGLLSSVHDVRLAMLECLAESRAFRFLTVVRHRLHDPDPKVRAVALEWVRRLEDGGAVRELKALLARSSILPSERLGIYAALAAIGGRDAKELLERGAEDASAPAELRELCKRSLTGPPF